MRSRSRRPLLATRYRTSIAVVWSRRWRSPSLSSCGGLMSLLRVLAVALLPCAALVACESHNTVAVAGGNGATVRLVNASSAKLDLVVNGLAATGDRALAFGVSSTCTVVDVTSGTVAIRITDST